MYSFSLNRTFLTTSERDIFNNYLQVNRLDPGIWGIFAGLFQSGTKHTTPLMLRVYEEKELCGAAILIRCRRYGKALFGNRILSAIIDLAGIPFYLWIRFGCCMDMMSNPGFVKDPGKLDDIGKAIGVYLKKNCILAIVYDYSNHAGLYPDASILPSLPHAIIDTSQMTDIKDYTGTHKNINHKMKGFRRKGGKVERVRQVLPAEDIVSLQKCFISTSETSVFYLPYQDLYLQSAINTSKTVLDNVIYFVARFNGEFLGYQAAIQSGKYLNALHGAFDRNRKTNYHAYDLMFVEMTSYAIEHQLDIVDFGAVLNITKQRMVNRIIEMSYFLLSKYVFFQFLFNGMLKLTRIQGREQLKFRA